VSLRSRLSIRCRIESAIRPIENVIDWAFPPDDLTQIANKYRSDKGNRFSSRHYYSRVYDQFLYTLRQRPITLLEIGLQWRRGSEDRDIPSLRMWRDYFPYAQLIGFDIEDFSNISLPNCRILQGNMSSREDLSQLVTFGPFDVVIDDGSHASAHQQIALAYLFPHVAPGGVYFIEDLNWQSPALESAGLPQTRIMLRRKVFESPVINATEAKFLTDNVESVQLFDTRGRGPFNRDKRDALGVLKKRV